MSVAREISARLVRLGAEVAGARQFTPLSNGLEMSRADHLRRATGLSMFGFLDYRGWPRCRLHSPRTERMTEKVAVTPSARSVQTKK